MIGETHLSYNLSRISFLILLILAAPLVCIPARGEEQPAAPAVPPSASAENVKWIPDGNENFLKALRAKDAQFDNVSATCKYEEIRMKYPARDQLMFLGGSESDQSDEPPLPPSAFTPYEGKTTTKRRLTVRNVETTLETQYYGDHNYKNRWSMKTPDPNNTILPEYRMHMEFSLGVGYGKRITSIEKVTPDGQFAVVEATIRLWSDDTTQARLKVDDHFVVREATLLVTIKRGDTTRYEISTKGLTKAQKGRQIALSGELKRTALTAVVNGKEITMPKDDVRDHFQIRVFDLQYDLDDATYRRLTESDGFR